MDCCEKKIEKYEVKGGKIKMNTRITLWTVIAVLFVTALFLTFKAGASGSVETIQATTNVAKSATSSFGGMVGGC